MKVLEITTFDLVRIETERLLLIQLIKIAIEAGYEVVRDYYAEDPAWYHEEDIHKMLSVLLEEERWSK